MILTRLILFMMSRGGERAVAPVFKSATDKLDQRDHARLQADHEAEPWPDAEGQQGGRITREEMTRIFGNALRVR